ncbi:MAG: redoxin domain-containing protein [Pirellulales bacterium]
MARKRFLAVAQKLAQLLLLVMIVGLPLGTAHAEDPPAAPPVDAPPPRDPSVLVRLVRSDVVQQELKLGSEEKPAIDKLVDEVEYPLFQLRDLPAEARRERIEKLADQIETVVAETLTAPQQQRLFEIVLRAHGWPALLAPQQAAAMKLSDKQIGRIREILGESVKSSQKLTTSAEEQIMKLLSDEQKSELARLAGAPFDFSRVPQVACRAPELREVTDWVNTKPLSLEALRGRVVALHFFAFGCSNCVNNQPHYKAWCERYAGKDVTVLGIHTPETARERDVANLRADVAARQLTYPIAVDAKNGNWNAWANHMWPSVYLIDKRGYVRYWWYGELNWQGAKGEEFMRQRIDELLAE